MDFFERQQRARLKTALLIVLLASIAVLIVGAYLAIAVTLVWRAPADEPVEFWRPYVFLGVTIGTLALIVGASIDKMRVISRGGGAVASMLGGTLILPNTADPDERRLLNIIEEMAIASGTPKPLAYALNEERGINAFAAGYGASDAAIAVTRVAMKVLTRDEMQGVIAHEFSHILNGDMRLNMRLIGLIAGMFAFTTLGRGFLDTAGRLPFWTYFMGLAFLILGSAGAFFGRLIQAAVSRERECLADAAALQFTRNSEGLAGALKKIGGLGRARFRSRYADEVGHIFFGSGIAPPWIRWMSTHPPLDERIRAIDPSFNGQYPRVVVPEEPRTMVQLPSAETSADKAWLADSRSAGAGNSSTGDVVQNIAFNAVRQRSAGETSTVPEELAQVARMPATASAVVCALLLREDANARLAQLDQIGYAGFASNDDLTRWSSLAATLSESARLALVEMTLPALLQLSRPQYARLTAVLKSLVRSDDRIDLFEYVVQKIVYTRMERHFKPQTVTVQYYALPPLARDCEVLLAALAHVCGSDKESVVRAYVTGLRTLPVIHSNVRTLAPPHPGMTQFDISLDRLALAAPTVKKTVLDACVRVAMAHGTFERKASGLLIAMAHAMDCPLPGNVK